jgi:hypothetical protein
VTYADALQAWHDFYVTVGAAAATLVGLLFVGLSLHIRMVVSHRDVRSLARATLTDFFVVLLIALVLLVPTGDPRTLGTWLIAIGAVSLLLVVRPALQAVRMRRQRAFGSWALATRFGLSAICFVGLATTGVIFGRLNYELGLNSLLILVIALLVVSVRNTWDLLVTVADRPEVDTTRHPTTHSR